ncbi:MAG: alpha/beta fold hydrolase [Anaerolineaceae bacterium]|nr:alpha/beta fold hydrolase [Anaerolineaceae bacterium]
MDLKKLKNEYPFSFNYFEIKGNKMHYLDEGKKNAPVILMVHGNPTWSFYYRNLVKNLRNNYRVIVPDHLGCGLSDKPQDYAYRIKDHIQNLSALIRHLEIDQYFLVIHDWGGPIGVGSALHAPEKVRGMVVLNTSLFYIDEIPWQIKLSRTPIIGELFVRGLNLFSIGAYFMAITQKEKRSQEVYDAYIQPYNSWKNRIAVYRFVQEIPLEENHPTRALLNELGAKTKLFENTPMLIAWGDQDFVFTPGDFCSEFEKRFPQAEIHHFPKAGHYVLEDEDEEIQLLVREFIDQISMSRTQE